jgi:hypothetical protein
MTVLAVFSGGIFWVIAALVIGLIKHLADAASEAKKSPPRAGPIGKPPGGAASADPMSEEERTRKFLEALGLPQGQLKPITQRPTAEKQSELRPTMEKAQRSMGERSVPPIVPPVYAPKPQKKMAGGWAPPQPPRRREPAPAIPSPAAQTMIERVHFAELKTPEVPSFQTTSSEVSAIPFELARSMVGQLYKAPDSAISTELRTLLSTPTALRSAILLREILGPPRSLQTAHWTGSLPPL